MIGLLPRKGKAAGVKNVRRNKNRMPQGNGLKASQQSFQRTRQNTVIVRGTIQYQSKQCRVSGVDCPAGHVYSLQAGTLGGPAKM